MEKVWKSYGEAADDYLEMCRKPFGGIGTGYSIDEDVGPMSPGEMALLWARSSAGKSTLLLNILANTSTIPTVFMSMEMASVRLYEWLTCMAFRLDVPYKNLQGLINYGEEDPNYAKVLHQLEEARIENAPQVWFVEPRGPTVDDFARVVDDITVKTGIRPVRVMVDHLSLMQGARDYEGVSTTSAQIHQWAQDDELAVVVAQQTGRGGNEQGQRNDGHLPVTLSSGLYAGEHDADWIWGVHRPERNPKFRKPAGDYKRADEYHSVQAERDRLKGLTVFSVIKNRPYGVLCEEGISLWYDNHTRQLKEIL